MMFAYRRVNTSTLVKGLGMGDLFLLPGIATLTLKSPWSPCGNQNWSPIPSRFSIILCHHTLNQKSAYWLVVSNMTGLFSIS